MVSVRGEMDQAVEGIVHHLGFRKSVLEPALEQTPFSLHSPDDWEMDSQIVRLALFGKAELQRHLYARHSRLGPI